MKEFINTKEFQITEPTVVTLGKFDGRHVGHQKLLRTLMEVKKERGYLAAVFTFHTAPGTVVNQNRKTVITTNGERRNNLRKIGIDYLVEYPFSQEIAHMEAADFVRKILVEKMRAKVIVVGTDCGFGYQRLGDARLLKEMATECGYELTVIEKEKDHHRDISSTYIREELDKGNMEKANELLGEPYSIHGMVVHGNHIGGELLGFPTANLLPPAEKHLPPFGVYVSLVLVDGKSYGGITNIGKKPTVEGENPLGVETYIFDWNQDLYGKEIEVQLLTRVRAEKKFSGLDALKEQIGRDKEFGKQYLESR